MERRYLCPLAQTHVPLKRFNGKTKPEEIHLYTLALGSLWIPVKPVSCEVVHADFALDVDRGLQ